MDSDLLSAVPTSAKVYSTSLGVQIAGDSRAVLKGVPDNTVDLVLTSPPFALLRQKSYGNEEQEAYVGWLREFAVEVLRVLRPTGSFVLDLGGAYQRGRPVRSLYAFRVLLDLCDNVGFRLAEEFYWHNPAKLPSPIEWVNKRKIRAKDTVDTVWWLSKSDFPKSDVRNVLVPYSERMKALLKDPAGFYTPKLRPSGHDIGEGFGNGDNGGAIPPNLLTVPNTESNSFYLRACKQLGRPAHPARFPLAIPRFFIDMLTEPGDTVLDIFSGSNATGRAAEERGRHWVAIDLDRSYAALSSVRFMEGLPPAGMAEAVTCMEHGGFVDLSAACAQPSLGV